jgi:hypothetical protein
MPDPSRFLTYPVPTQFQTFQTFNRFAPFKPVKYFRFVELTAVEAVAASLLPIASEFPKVHGA